MQLGSAGPGVCDGVQEDYAIKHPLLEVSLLSHPCSNILENADVRPVIIVKSWRIYKDDGAAAELKLDFLWVLGA